jgi:hypothetical protein
MGVNLWGESPLYMNPVPSFYDGNESTSRRQGPSPSYGVSRGRYREVSSLSADRQVKEVGVQSYEPSLPRTRSGEQESHTRPDTSG